MSVFFEGSSPVNPVAAKDLQTIKSVVSNVTNKVMASAAIKFAFGFFSSNNQLSYRDEKIAFKNLQDRVITHLSSLEQLKGNISSIVKALAQKVESCSKEVLKLQSSINELEIKKKEAEGQAFKEDIQQDNTLIACKKLELESKQDEKASFETIHKKSIDEEIRISGHINEIKQFSLALDAKIQQINPLSRLSNQGDRTSLIKELAFRIFYELFALPQPIIDKLSGTRLDSSLKKMITDLETKDKDGNLVFKKIMGDTNYNSCLEKLKQLSDVIVKILSYKGNPDQVETIMSAFTSLEVGQSKLFPGGYFTRNAALSGHAVIYEFKRVADDAYELSLYNTGAGSFFYFGKKVETYSLTHKQMNDINFWTGFLEFMIQDSHQPALEPSIQQNTERSMSQVYGYLNNSLGKAKTGQSIEAQTWGNCTYMSLKAWVTGRLSEIQKKEFHTTIRQLAADELKDALPHLSEQEKTTIFGNEVISHLDRKVELITNHDTGIWAKIKRVWYYVRGYIINYFYQFVPKSTNN
jgi:hypothetical protein